MNWQVKVKYFCSSWQTPIAFSPERCLKAMPNEKFKILFRLTWASPRPSNRNGIAITVIIISHIIDPAYWTFCFVLHSIIALPLCYFVWTFHRRSLYLPLFLLSYWLYLRAWLIHVNFSFYLFSNVHIIFRRIHWTDVLVDRPLRRNPVTTQETRLCPVAFW